MLENEIKKVELSLRELARDEVIEHARHRNIMREIRAERAAFEKQLEWLQKQLN